MNKKLFRLLVFFMGISVLGIIAVQLVWINNAIRVKNEMFNRGVNEAMLRTVNRLDDLHNLSVITNMAFTKDSINILTNFGLTTGRETIPEKQLTRRKHSIQTNRKLLREKEHALIKIKVNNDSQQTNVQTLSYGTNSTLQSRITTSDNRQKTKDFILFPKDSIILSADSLYSISTIKIDSLLSSLDTFIVSPEFTKRIDLKAGALKHTVNKIVTEISEWDINELNDTLIAETLKEELQENQITPDFEYGIIRNDAIRFPMPVNDSGQVYNTKFKVNLYPDNILQRNIELAVYFPGKDRFIYRSLNWLLVASFFFSLFILLSFAFSIYYILRQKKISEMKSDFINNMTHEFKTPIATISVAADSITNLKVITSPERIRYFSGMIKKENTRMNRQVEDLLTIAQLDRKDFEFNWEKLNIHELIEEAVKGISLQTEQRKGTIRLDLNAENPHVTSDRVHGTNILHNLIDNANKYSVEAPEIKISTKNCKTGILIAIEDKGIGMSKAILSKIFERFYRQGSGNIHNVKGFGLGLSYVKAVTEANHGSITVQSTPGKGSIFELFLPYER